MSYIYEIVYCHVVQKNTIVYECFLSQDITRIARSLSKSVKSNIPRTESEFGPGQHVDINAVLSVLEDFVRQNNKTSDSTLSKTQPQLPGVFCRG